MVGFRSTTPLLTGNTQVAAMGLPSIPSVNPGFRMRNTNMPLPGLGFRAGPSVGGGITGTFGGGIDPNIFANYTPSNTKHTQHLSLIHISEPTRPY